MDPYQSGCCTGPAMSPGQEYDNTEEIGWHEAIGEEHEAMISEHAAWLHTNACNNVHAMEERMLSPSADEPGGLLSDMGLGVLSSGPNPDNNNILGLLDGGFSFLDASFDVLNSDSPFPFLDPEPANIPGQLAGFPTQETDGLGLCLPSGLQAFEGNDDTTTHSGEDSVTSGLTSGTGQASTSFTTPPTSQQSFPLSSGSQTRGPYFCRLPENGKKGCNTRYDKPSERNKHEKYHMSYEDREHVCDVEGCGLRFVLPKDLRRHIKGANKLERPYACGQCDYLSTRNDHLLRHIRAKHAVATLPSGAVHSPGYPTPSDPF